MSIIRAIVEFIKKLFSKPPAPPPLVLPHPEEPKDETQTIGNVNISDTLRSWLTGWDVPQEHWFFWENKITITVRTDINYPAGAYDIPDGRHIDIRPEWLNPGILAHEACHVSYALLGDIKKTEFDSKYDSIKDNDPMIKLMRQLHPYANMNNIEAHAEVGRYLGIFMPALLKDYYPQLWS